MIAVLVDNDQTFTNVTAPTYTSEPSSHQMTLPLESNNSDSGQQDQSSDVPPRKKGRKPSLKQMHTCHWCKKVR